MTTLPAFWPATTLKMPRAPWILHPAEVAVLDRNAVALGLSISELMQAAAAALTATAQNMLNASVPSKIHICLLCGPGNNGGDGYAAAHLLERQGYNITIIATAARQHSSEAQNYRELCRQSAAIKIRTQPQIYQLRQDLQSADLLIDCLLGAGFRGDAPRAYIDSTLQLCNELQQKRQLPPLLACDMPSAMKLQATRTLSFHAPKLNMYDANGTLLPEVGELEIAPLPWPEETTDCGPGELLRLPPLNPQARKGERGRLLIIGGGPYHGAPLLAAQAAGRSGCDLVHLAMPRSAAARVHWPLFIIPEASAENASDDYLDEHSGKHLLQRCRQQHFDAILLGPGMGRHPATLEAAWNLLQALISMEIPVVLDADALYMLAQKCPGSWPSLTGDKEKIMRGIATPHRGELRRWLGDPPPQDLLETQVPQQNAAEQQLVLCSGSRDQLSSPGGRSARCSGGHPRMACAGTGDLLAGLCASFLAQGMAPWPAGRLAAYTLRQAGNLAALDWGLGLVADDIPKYISRFFATMRDSLKV